MKKLIYLCTALTLFSFSTMFCGYSEAKTNVEKPNLKKETISYSQNTKQSKNKIKGTKNILIIKKDTPKINGITYPDYNVEQILINDEEDAMDYLSNILENLKGYDLVKNDLIFEDDYDFIPASENEHWYFAYGRTVKGNFIVKKYIAVTEFGEILEYNISTDTWYTLKALY